VPERASDALLARVAVLGGRGAVGRLFVGALAGAGCEVLAIDRAGGEPPAIERVPGEPRERDGATVGARGRVRDARLDVEQSSAQLRDLLAGTDAVVLALPEAAALRGLPHVLGALAPGALLVDTLSVKGPFADALLARAADAAVEALSLNPMFAPALGFAGRPVLAVELAGGPRSHALLALIEAWGARVVAVGDARRHDELAAALQVVPHAALLAFGLALERLGDELGALVQVAPPPFLALLALLARIASAAPETYWDIQDANPRAARARDALATGLADLDAAARAHDAGAFDQLLERLRALLGEQREPLAARAAQIVAHAAPVLDAAAAAAPGAAAPATPTASPLREPS
jgi:prephenate dehydrogenase